MGRDDIRAAFDAVLAGTWTPVQVGAFAVALLMRGETAEQIVAAAEAMRAAMTPVEHELSVVVDTCGTGGDGSHTLNLSSASALVVAASGFAVAKHGNRSISSRCGSADVVEALGIPIDVPPERQGEVLRQAGIAFLLLLLFRLPTPASITRSAPAATWPSSAAAWTSPGRSPTPTAPRLTMWYWPRSPVACASYWPAVARTSTGWCSARW